LGHKEFLSKISLERLAEMLQQTLVDAEKAAPKVDLPAFLSQLDGIMKQAGFKEEGVGYTPVVQGSVSAIFQEMQKMIDFAKIRIEKVSENSAQKEVLFQEWQASGEAQEGEIVQEPIVAEENIVTPALLDEEGSNPVNPLGDKAKPQSELGFPHQVGSDGAAKTEAMDFKSVHPRLRMSPEMQHFTMDQISQTVLRGLKNGQHHLTLTLYPKEMGEVKVDMHVKDNQVSLTFLMENPKVKQLLESNMQEFRNNMEQRGFVLAGCDVSVDQNSKGDSQERQFELAKTWQDENQRRATLAEITELLTAGQTASLSYHDGAINMIV
jgi:flagellar hook-length control protein FliK